MYGLAFTTSSSRPGDDPVERARAVWKLRAFEIQHGRDYEFLHKVEEFFEIVFVQPKHGMFGITKWRSSGVPMKKLYASCINA